MSIPAPAHLHKSHNTAPTHSLKSQLPLPTRIKLPLPTRNRLLTGAVSGLVMILLLFTSDMMAKPDLVKMASDRDVKLDLSVETINRQKGRRIAVEQVSHLLIQSHPSLF